MICDHALSFKDRDSHNFEWDDGSFYAIEKCVECGKEFKSKYTLVYCEELK